jgi:hypothetical protein
MGLARAAGRGRVRRSGTGTRKEGSESEAGPDGPASDCLAARHDWSRSRSCPTVTVTGGDGRRRAEELCDDAYASACRVARGGAAAALATAAAAGPGRAGIQILSLGRAARDSDQQCCARVCRKTGSGGQARAGARLEYGGTVAPVADSGCAVRVGRAPHRVTVSLSLDQ